MNELTQATNHALEQINQATTNADVDNAKGDGLNAINPIAPVTVVKQAARDAVSHDAQQHIAEINANPDATQEERQAAIEKVNAAVTAANTNILNANTNADVEQVKTNAIQGIQAITPATKVKTDAKMPSIKVRKRNIIRYLIIMMRRSKNNKQHNNYLIKL